MGYQRQISILIIFISSVLCQNYSTNSTQSLLAKDEKCSNTTGQVCMNLYDCKYFIDLIRAEERYENILDEIKRVFCRFEPLEKTFYVCCPSKQVLKRSSISSNVATDFQRKQERFESEAGECGTGSTDRTIGGSYTKIDEFPWAVQLYYKNHSSKSRDKFVRSGVIPNQSGNRNRPYRSYCGGVLINYNHVLIVAHCVNAATLRRKNISLEYVRLGEWNTSTQNDCSVDANNNQYQCAHPHINIPIASVKLHEKFYEKVVNRTHTNDVAIIRLVKKIPRYTNFIRAICLPFADHLRSKSYANETLTATGWGKTEAGRPSTVKLFVTLPAFTNEECHGIYEKLLDIKDTQICAGGIPGFDTCRGDSGGPLMNVDDFNKERQYWYLVGITSFGPLECGKADWPGVYTRIDKYLDWILANIVY